MTTAKAKNEPDDDDVFARPTPTNLVDRDGGRVARSRGVCGPLVVGRAHSRYRRIGKSRLLDVNPHALVTSLLSARRVAWSPIPLNNHQKWPSPSSRDPPPTHMTYVPASVYARSQQPSAIVPRSRASTIPSSAFRTNVAVTVS